MEKKRVAVIGAGASGLISTKICLEDGLDTTCFEMTSDIGGLWNYSSSLIHKKGSVMKSTIINSSKENMAFSDFPAPKEFSNFMHNRKLLEYFRLYAQNFKLFPSIKFNTIIKTIVQTEDYDTTGRWRITYKEKDEEEKSEIFDGVMMCIGHHAYPHTPKFKGLNDENAKFKGEYIHSWEYRDPYKYIDKRMLIIGVGNSGGDIAVEQSRISSQVYLSTRSGLWCTPRCARGGRPSDITYLNRFFILIEQICPKTINKILQSDLNKWFDHELYALKPHDERLHHIFVNDDIPNRIASGTLIIKPNIREFTEHSCIFDDGTVVDNIDIVILSTGYSIGFPILGDKIIPVENNWVRLYKYVFPSNLKHPTMAVMGCIQPFGSINPIVEMQARWLARVFKGLTKLPSKDEMDRDIDYKAESVKKKFYESQRHTIQVDFIPYMDELANLVGCKPILSTSAII